MVERQRSIASRRRSGIHESAHIHTSYGHNIRKFSLITETGHGLIEAQGADLKIVTVDPRVCRILGWASDDAAPGPSRPPAAGLPATVHELLPAELRGLHRRLLSRAVAAGRLPDALRAPMRGVELLRLDGAAVRVDVCVGLVTQDLPLDSPDCLFYALVSESAPPPPPLAHGEGGGGEAGRATEEQLGMIEALYGLGASTAVSRGELPRPDAYDLASRPPPPSLSLDEYDLERRPPSRPRAPPPPAPTPRLDPTRHPTAVPPTPHQGWGVVERPVTLSRGR